MKLVFKRKHCESKGIKCGNVIYSDIRGNKTPPWTLCSALPLIFLPLFAWETNCPQSHHCYFNRKDKGISEGFFLFYGAIWHLLIQNFLWLPRWEERTQRLGSIVHSWSLAPGLRVPWCRSLSAEAREVTRIPPVYHTSLWKCVWMLTHARTYKHTRMEFAFDFNADFASLLLSSS